MFLKYQQLRAQYAKNVGEIYDIFYKVNLRFYNYKLF